MKPLLNYALLIVVVWFCSAHTMAGVIQEDTTYTSWLKIKKKHPDIKIVNPTRHNNLISTENVVYKTIIAENCAARDLKLDSYRPPQKSRFPALIMVHRGGCRSGNKSMERPMAQQIALQGFVTILVEMTHLLNQNGIYSESFTITDSPHSFLAVRTVTLTCIELYS